MPERVKKIYGMKFTVPVMLLLLIALQLLHITFIIGKREALHSDEVFSFALANSFYEPYLDCENISDSNVRQDHQNKWISADVIRNYVTVQKGQQFRYDSVWYNQANDRHPPFYYSVIHTVCSFFPDTFEPWIGYIINFICFAVMQFFLFRLSRKLLKSKFLALLVCMLFGFSVGAVNMVIFIRMYCMLAMWSVILLSLHSDLCVSDGKRLAPRLAAIFAVTLCGALTQYLFLFVAFVTAVCFCVRYLIKKKWKLFLAYGLTMLAAAGAAMLVFPAYLPNLFSEVKSGSADMWHQFALCLSYLTTETLGIDRSGLVFWIPTLLSIAAALIVMSVPVLFLLRDNKRVVAFIGRKKQSLKSIKNFSFRKTLGKISARLKQTSVLFIVLLLSILLVCFITARSVSFGFMGYIDRYLFILYPLNVVLFALICAFLFSWSKHKKAVLAFVFAFLTALSLGAKNEQYLFRYEQEVKNVRELTADANCIFVYSGLEDAWLMDYLPAEMYDADRLFIAYAGDTPCLMDEISSLQSDKPLYLFIQIPDIPYAEGLERGITMHRATENGEYITETISPEEYKKDYAEPLTALPGTKKTEHLGKCTFYNRSYDVFRLA